ncbi:unnamed protein product, partial [Brachionus calyciflorus]
MDANAEYNGDENNNQANRTQFDQNKTKRKREIQCKCGSTTHVRTSHHSCTFPDNKRTRFEVTNQIGTSNQELSQQTNNEFPQPASQEQTFSTQHSAISTNQVSNMHSVSAHMEQQTANQTLFRNYSNNQPIHNQFTFQPTLPIQQQMIDLQTVDVPFDDQFT